MCVEFTAGARAPPQSRTQASVFSYRCPGSESVAAARAAGKLQSWALVPLLLLIGSAARVGHSPALASVYPIEK